MGPAQSVGLGGRVVSGRLVYCRRVEQLARLQGFANRSSRPSLRSSIRHNAFLQFDQFEGTDIQIGPKRLDNTGTIVIQYKLQNLRCKSGRAQKERHTMELVT